ncbi:gamma-glutamylcyclotransferase [Bacillus sp. V5-8f]|uniref:gamma-glutamylcyclotransferase n=1 Tax=Bacillus sp. V5-8f TaxID=2053044 RepID=UPI000C781931|nr:gamma-glutamylcyclotransferase family protein [Bacillus sp. V5-8f]PLT35135.1 gamma-glutamylcyclotransferase [Bacillus sp. V5-8f]
MKDKIMVFVYGTLRKHERNHHFLENERCFAEQAWMNGRLMESNSGLPFLEVSKEGKVFGELYEVSFIRLQHLDWLEDYEGPGKDNLYDRLVQRVYTNTGSYDAFVYVAPSGGKLEDMKAIKGGDWRVHRFRKEKAKYIYFAYASCMDHERFKSSGVDHLFQNIKGCGTLRGYSLRFTKKSYDGGRADIVEEGGVVEGKVYEVSQEGLDYLYMREGVGLDIYRPALVDIEINGNTVENVVTFIVVDKDEETAPPVHYLEEILRGGSGLLSDAYMQELKDRLEVNFHLKIE